MVASVAQFLGPLTPSSRCRVGGLLGSTCHRSRSRGESMLGMLATPKWRTALLLVTLMVGAFACDADHHHARAKSTSTPTAFPPTPTALPPTPTAPPPTPTTCPLADDTIGTLYEVLDGSVFIYSPSPGSELVTEPLTGTFRLQRIPPGPDPNVRLAWELRALRLCGGAEFIIESIDGNNVVGFLGFVGPIIPVSFFGSVNSQESTIFDGSGPYHLDDQDVLVLDGVELCAPPIPGLRCRDFPNGTEQGYYIKMFAAPKTAP
jgi:hypothetical protein